MSKYTTSILITGGTQGLGHATALNLARENPQALIILAARSDRENVTPKMNSTLRQSNVAFMPLDLNSLAAIRDFASRWTAASHPPISSLVMNAGIQFPGDIEYTKDGIEASFGVNHVGHSLLFHLLAPHLTPTARIVVVASGVHDPAKKWGLVPHYTSAAEVATPNAAAIKESAGRDRYATSKVANVLWAKALGRRLAAQGSGKSVVALDPGLMFPTNLARNAAWIIKFLSLHIVPHVVPVLKLVNSNINHVKESGGNLAYLATAEEVRQWNGEYFEKREVMKASEQAQREELQEELWRWTVERVSEGEEERRRFERVE